MTRRQSTRVYPSRARLGALDTGGKPPRTSLEGMRVAFIALRIAEARDRGRPGITEPISGPSEIGFLQQRLFSHPIVESTVVGGAGKLTEFNGPVPSAKTAFLSEEALTIDCEAKKLCAGLSEEQLSWQPRARSWSIAQVLAHLRLTNEAFQPAVDAALEASRNIKLRGEEPFALSVYGRFLVWRMEARPIVKMQSPRLLRPGRPSPAALELSRFLASQAAFRQRLADAEGLDLTAFRFASPVAFHFRVNLLEFFSAFNAHARRHLWQGRNVRRAMSVRYPEDNL